ncbi:MAG: hypothetical protein LH632_14470 [Rhodoferax sp.]|nr:hypothetical protein [Rhodoferax sp.]
MALLLLGLRGVQATAPGRVMLSHARTVLQQVELLRSEIGRVASGKSRRSACWATQPRSGIDVRGAVAPGGLEF